MPAKRPKQTIHRKNAGKTSKKSNPQRHSIQMSVHRTQAVFLLLLFAIVGGNKSFCNNYCGCRIQDR